MVLLIGSFTGLVRGASPPTVEISGLKPVTVPVGIGTTFHVNVSGGLVDSTHPWTLYWFFGRTNASGISFTKQTVSAVGTGCTLASNCTSSVADNISFSYNQTGTYDVSVTAYDGNFDYHILSAVVNVTDPATICVNPTSTSAIIGQSVTLFARATSPSEGGDAFSYLWDFGDGNRSSGTLTTGYVACGNDQWKNTVSHAFAEPGTHLVTVTAVDAHGSAARGFIFVNVTDPGPTMLNVSVPSNASAGASVNMSANATDPSDWDLGNLTFAWNFGDGTNWTISSPYMVCQYGTCWDEDQVSHVYAKTGTYQVTSEVYNPEGNASLHPHHGRNAYLTANITIHQLRIPCPYCVPIPSTGIISPICPWWNLSCLGIPWYSPLNETYVSPSGKTYGFAGLVSSWQYGAQDVSAYFNGTGSDQKTEQTLGIDFKDTTPVVGVTGLYVVPTITLALTGGGGAPSLPSCPYASIQLDLNGPGGVIIASGTLVCGQTFVTLPAVNLYLGNAYSVTATYQANGPSGTTPVQMSFSYPGNPNPVTYSWTFSNSNPSTWTWTVDADMASLGQQVNIQTEVFSPADVPLTVNWTFGDGTRSSTVAPAPPSPGPNLQTVTVTHTWANGAVYALQVTAADPVSGGQGGLTGQDSITITEVGDASASDTAPIPSLSVPSTAFTETTVGMSDAPTDVDQSVGIASEPWSFGDGQTAAGGDTSHLYPYSGQYLVVATATSSQGSQGVAMAFVSVTNPPPVAVLGCTPSTVVVGQPVLFDASNSSMASPGLAYWWNFGDGTIVSGPNATARIVHAYLYPGTYVAQVTVTDPDGKSSSASCTIHVNAVGQSNPPTPGVSLVNETVTAGQFSKFAVQLVGGLPATSLAFLNVTWVWGGYDFLPSNANGTHAISSGHTYLFPGVYSLQAIAVDPFFTGPQLVNLGATVTVVDPRPWVSLPYYGASIYGENHTSNLTATALGTWGDAYSGRNWNFTFAWGDASRPTSLSSYYPNVMEGHVYTTSGPANLDVSATTPEPAGVAATGSTSDSLNLVADWDGDGLSNAYEQLVSNTSIYYDNTTLKEGSIGYGLTDFLSALFDGKLGNLSADQDGDGLTSAQELEGTVTGYFSNPLDPNTAGDGVPDGSHFFTDEFRAVEVVPLNATGSTSVDIPNVYYGGDAAGFNQSVLTVEMSTAGSPSDLTISTCPSGSNSCVSLGTPVNLTPSYYLVNQTPIFGQTSAYNLTLSDLQSKSNWTVEVTVKSGHSVTGNVTFAAIRDSYYTNPALADPYHQGMLALHTLTTPVFNCSAPTNESYPVINWSTPSLSYVNYWPYTEAYSKLSKTQGVPYVQGTNANMTGGNNATSCQGLVSSSHFHDIATYLGDADFGISPWNAHAAGDSRLTNGMKALGKADYSATAWKYESEGGTMTSLSGTDPYPSDSYGVNEPLNPTALSTSGDGTPDSYTANPIGPPVFDLTIKSAVDPTYRQTLTDQVGAFVAQSGQEVYTPAASGTGGTFNSSCGTSGVSYSFNDHYVLPLDPNTSKFSVELDLLNDGGGSISKDNATYLNGSLSSSKVIWAPSNAAINASGQVAPMNRTPTILANTTQELLNLPGYGYRYQGDPQFYALYVNSTVQVTQNGTTIQGSSSGILNVILESRQALLNSTFGRDQSNGTLPSCLSGVTSLTVRNDTPSETGVAGTYTINLTSVGCGDTLLSSLLAKSWNGTKGKVIGAYSTLNTSQVELLGLTTQSLELAPFEPASAFDSPLGPVPTAKKPCGLLCQLTESFTSLIVGSLVALWNFMGTVAHLAVEFGQLVLGLFSKAVRAAENAAQIAWNALKQLLNAIVAIARALVSVLISPIESAMATYTITLESDSSTLWSEYNNSSGKNVSTASALGFFEDALGLPLILAMVLATGTLVVLTIIDGFTLGAGFFLGMVLGLLVGLSVAGIASKYGDPGNFFSTRAVSVAWNFTNESQALQPALPLQAQNSPPAWEIILAAVTGIGGLFGTYQGGDAFIHLLAGMLSPADGSPPSIDAEIIYPLVSLALGAAALFLFFYIETHSLQGGTSFILEVTGAIIAIFGFITAVGTYVYFAEDMPLNVRQESQFGIGVGAAACGAGIFLIGS